MTRLATFGYGMNLQPTGNIKKANIFRQCLQDAAVDLLLDTRYSPWGGYWNPKEIAAILQGTQVQYAYKYGDSKLHELLGVPKAMREIKPFAEFARIYTASLTARTLEPISAINACLAKYKPNKLAIMCCEPFVATKDNCHRFVLADILVAAGIVDQAVEHLSMDATWEKMATKIRTSSR